VVLLATASATQAGAQDSAEVLAHASPRLPAGHWAEGAAARIAAAGLAPSLLRLERGLTVEQARLALHEAAASERIPAFAPLVHAWQRRLAAEFPAPAARGLRGWGAWRVGAAHATAQRDSGGAAPASRWISEPESGTDLRAHGYVAASLGGRLAGRAELSTGGERPRLGRAEAVAAAWGLRAAAARETLGYGWGQGGGVTLSSPLPLDHMAIATARPVTPAGLLRHAGPVAFHTALGRFARETDHPGSPYLWSASLGFRPHPRVEVLLNRAILFGGDSASAQATPGRLAASVLGSNGGTNFENQVASFEGRLRLPTERFLPLLVYAEWGSDDGAGGWDEAPGVIAGIFAPVVPGVPQFSVGVERASLRYRCCRTFPVHWYEHAALTFAAGGTSLGHPLAGNGAEWLLYARGDLLDGRVSLDLRGFLRDRTEGNLVGAARLGRSRGGSFGVHAQLTRRAVLSATAEGETADRWRTGGYSVAAGWNF
jgi:hypothetical protein